MGGVLSCASLGNLTHAVLLAFWGSVTVLVVFLVSALYQSSVFEPNYCQITMHSEAGTDVV